MRALLPFGRESRNVLRPPMTVFDTLQREVDRLFDDFSRGFGSGSGALSPSTNLMPSMDVTETDKEIKLTVELPGLEQEDVDISVTDNLLTISGEKRVEEERDERNAHVVERAYGRFYRAVPLPQGVDPSSIQATMSNGVLRIIVPKPARMEARKIEVKQDEARPSQSREGQPRQDEARQAGAKQGEADKRTGAKAAS
jgi:HSP20 family protein